jgi:NADH:ubiquinone oxidoreductase subunit 6 (subunit J)
MFLTFLNKILPLAICLATLAQLFTLTATRSDNRRLESAKSDFAACGVQPDILIFYKNYFFLFGIKSFMLFILKRIEHKYKFKHSW